MSWILIPLPISTRTFRFLLFCLSVFFVALGFGSFSGDEFSDGLILVGAGGIAFLVSVVYLSRWYENTDYGLRIIELILIVAVAGGILGMVLYGLRGAIGGAILVGLVAEVVGFFCSLYLHVRDEREAREFDRETEKYSAR